MPVFNKMPFRKRKPDPSIKDTDSVYYLESSNEVFATYEEFFARYIHLNSLAWTCAITGKSGLSFDEALKSEADALTVVEDNFPKPLIVPLLWLAHNYCYRGKLDDLVNDLYVVSRDRYFIGETVWYNSESRRMKGKILAVHFDPKKARLLKKDKKKISFVSKIANDENATDNTGAKKSYVIKPEDPEMPHPDAYSYSLRPVEEKDTSTITGIKHTSLNRFKSEGSRVKLRLLLKKIYEISGDKIILPLSIVKKYKLSRCRWEDFFDGPLPEFPKTERRLPGAPAGANDQRKRKASSPSNCPPPPKKSFSKSTEKVKKAQPSILDCFKPDKSQNELSKKEIGEMEDSIKAALNLTKDFFLSKIAMAIISSYMN